MGIRDSFKRAKATVEAAKEDVKRPADEVAAKRAKKQEGKK